MQHLPLKVLFFLYTLKSVIFLMQLGYIVENFVHLNEFNFKT